MNESVSIIAEKLLEQGKTVATAESCTGGLIGAAFTALSGSSEWYKGGVVSYANEAKQNLLGVKEEILNSVGAVSEEVATQMVQGVIKALNTDYGIAVTGIAGPGGGTEEKPVGLVYIGTISPDGVTVTKNIFDGDRDSVREQTVQAALKQLIEMM